MCPTISSLEQLFVNNRLAVSCQTGEADIPDRVFIDGITPDQRQKTRKGTGTDRWHSEGDIRQRQVQRFEEMWERKTPQATIYSRQDAEDVGTGRGSSLPQSRIRCYLLEKFVWKMV